jgi:2-desacetyl-2-hydroxyethyl bacteriochlorophyllide A dehydrogenase
LQSYWTVPAAIVHKVPAKVALRTAALVEPLAVACHDVGRASLAGGESVVVFGAGPVGLLIALLARHKGARVLITDINPTRLELARSLELEAVPPDQLTAAVEAMTGETGADVVFEVTGAAAAIAEATGLLRTRGRLVVVGIHSEPHPVDLFRVFWRELHLLGARVYEPEDFDEAIALTAESVLPLDRLITAVVGLDELAEAFEKLQAGGDAVKVLVALKEEQ